MDQNRPIAVTLGQFTAVSAPFAILFAWSMLQPELGQNLDLDRTRLTIWATTILLGPALLLYMFRSLSQTTANLAHLFWTFAWLVFVAHAYWAVFIIFDGIADTFEQQGTLIASGNFLLLGWWTIDVLLLWLTPAGAQWRWYVLQQRGVRILAFLIFAATLVLLRGGSVRALGIAFTTVIVLGVLVRLGTHVRASNPEVPAT